MTDQLTLYHRAGGTPFFEALVGRFLIQYWGGPTTYDQDRGHPRLRMRHAPFAIGPAERDAWLTRMRAAMADLAPPPDVAAELERYFAMAAEAMRNR